MAKDGELEPPSDANDPPGAPWAASFTPPRRDVEPPSESLHANERRCADCGRVVSKYRGRWADYDRPDDEQRAAHLTCRDHVVTLPDGSLRLEAADYHYVEGETQRHWVAP